VLVNPDCAALLPVQDRPAVLGTLVMVYSVAAKADAGQFATRPANWGRNPAQQKRLLCANMLFLTLLKELVR
jgi:hypothetical protein